MRLRSKVNRTISVPNSVCRKNELVLSAALILINVGARKPLNQLKCLKECETQINSRTSILAECVLLRIWIVWFKRVVELMQSNVNNSIEMGHSVRDAETMHSTSKQRQTKVRYTLAHFQGTNFFCQPSYCVYSCDFAFSAHHNNSNVKSYQFV